jgi:hypothetical protein
MTHEEFHAMRQEIAALRRQMQGVYDYVVAERQRQQQAWLASVDDGTRGPNGQIGESQAEYFGLRR